MLEILVIIAVVKAFTRKAVEKNLSRGLWGFIGAASYYGPILINSFFILPYLIGNGIIDLGNEGGLQLKAIGINLVVGITCCFLAYQFLKNAKAAPDIVDSEILDSNLN
jgi:hypothetical protein